MSHCQQFPVMEPNIFWICCRKITDLAEKVGFKNKGDTVL